MSTPSLLSPIRINSLEIANRTYMPSMLTNFAAINGEVTDRFIAYYEERAKGGVGIVTVEGTAVSASAKPFIRGLSIADDQKKKGLSRLASAIKKHGARASMQIIHGGRCINPTISGHPIPMVSYVPAFCPNAESYVLDADDIEAIIADFASAALRAKECGFDLIELHGAHGYLLNQFTSPLTNHREDEYGGSVLKRARFSIRVIEAVRKAVGPDFPVVYRHTAEDGLENGLTLEDTLEMVNPLIDAGLDALHISAGMPETKHWISPPPCMPQGWKQDVAKAVKEHIQNRVPVITVGRFTDPAVADVVIQEGKADMVAFGRALIADPFLIKKYAQGQKDEITYCISCNEGCTGRTGKLLDISCTVNPRVGLEMKYPLDSKSESLLNIAIVGGGPAGMQAALSAAKLGHTVTIFEAKESLGGLLPAASTPPFKSDIAEYLIGQVAKINIYSNITVKCNHFASVSDLDSFDRVILACGSKAIVPGFAAGMKNTVSAEDILLKKVSCGERVLVIGGGMVGCETAEWLASQKKSVSILEQLPAIASDMEWRARHTLMQRLDKYNVNVMVGTRFLSANDSMEVSVQDKYGRTSVLDAFDTIVLAVGYKSNIDLMPLLDDAKKAYTSIGDCQKVGKIMEAVFQGFTAINSL